MASINGLSVNNRKNFTDPEGFLYCQGDIFLADKKIAFWSQSGFGALSDTLDMEEGYSPKKLLRKLAELNEGSLYSFEIFMDRLMRLMDTEKRYEKAVKDGYVGILETTDNRFTTITWTIPAEYEGKDILKEFSDMLKKAHEERLKGEMISDCYYTKGSFCIGDPVKLSEIMC